MTVELRSPEGLDGAKSTPCIVRYPIFETETTVMANSHIHPGTTTGSHHHGDRETYGHLLSGEATIEHGPEARERDDLQAPSFFHVHARPVHCETVTSDEAATVVVAFVGSGPVGTNGDGPAPE